MKKLVIAGAGGMGREMVWLVDLINRVTPTWQIKGFLDDTMETINNLAQGLDIIGTIQDWIPAEDEYFVVAIYNNHGRKAVAEKLKEKGAKFATLIQPYALVAESAHFGTGCIVFTNASVGVNSSLGDFCYVQGGAIIGDDDKIGNYVTAASRSFIGGRSIIGDFAYIGTGALICPERNIGKDACVGIGSVVIRNIKDGVHVFGNPAKKIN